MLTRSIRIIALVALMFMAISVPAAGQRHGPPRLGAIDFPTSAGARAQQLFEQGVLWMHSFEYDSAAAAFRRAQDAEPDFVLAYWGEAMTHNHPVWNERDAGAARAILGRLGPTPEARAAKATTERERAWLGAAEVLWAEGPKPARDTAYARAMEALASEHPGDEADAFHALALLGLSQGVRDIPSYMRAGAITLALLARAPNHPGAAHYTIHAFDDPDHAILGLEAAESYSRIAPDAGHAQHMTTHIFLALGRWDRVSRQNVVAMRAATGQSDSLAWRPGHYTWWLSYSRLQEGRWRDVESYLNAQARAVGDLTPTQHGLLNFLRDEYMVTTRDWASPFMSWPDVAGERSASTHLVHALAAYEAGNRNELERRAQAVADLRASARDNADLRLIDAQTRALVSQSHGDTEHAIELLREATAFEAGLPMDFGPPHIVRPAHEALAEMLLEAGRAEDAMHAFQRALARTPGRSRTLAGLANAARAAGQGALADRTLSTLRENFRNADAGVLERLMATYGSRAQDRARR